MFSLVLERIRICIMLFATRALYTLIGMINPADTYVFYGRTDITDFLYSVKTQHFPFYGMMNSYYLGCARGYSYDVLIDDRNYAHLVRSIDREPWSLRPQSTDLLLAHTSGTSLGSRIEDFLAFIINVSHSSSITGVISGALMFAKTYHQTSLIDVVRSCLDEWQLETQASGDVSVTQVLETLRMARDNWAQAVRSPGIQKVRRLFSILIAAGMCESSRLDFSVRGVRLFALEACKAPVDGLTISEAILDTVVFFIEGGYRCFLTKSFTPLLISDSRADEFIDSYTTVMSYANLVRAGNLDLIAGVSENEYDKMLTDVTEECKLLIKTCESKFDKALFQKKHLDLIELRSSYDIARLAGGTREAPFCVGIWGESGVGKTSIAQILMHAILEHNNFSSAPDRLVTLNERDKYMSNYRSHVNGIYIDDQGNSKPNFCEKSPASTMIELVNNVRMYAVMADLELKGRVSVQPKVVIVTKNPKLGGAQHYSVEPVSIARREKFLIKAEVLPQFQVNGMLNNAEIVEWYDSRGMKKPVIPDYWKFTVESAYPIPTEGSGPAQVGWKQHFETESIEDLLNHLYIASRRHFRDEKEIVQRNNCLRETIISNSCPKCKRLFCENTCSEDDRLDEQMGNTIVSAIVLSVFPVYWEALMTRLFGKKWKTFLQRFWVSRYDIERVLSTEMANLSVWAIDTNWDVLLQWIPPAIYKSVSFQNVFFATINQYSLWHLRRSVTVAKLVASWLLLRAIYGIYNFDIWCFVRNVICLAIVYVWSATRLNRFKQSVYRHTFERDIVVAERVHIARGTARQWLVGACAVAGGIYATYKVWEHFKCLQPQGALDPISEEEVEGRDAERNVWATPVCEEMEVQEITNTMTEPQMQKKVSKNLVHVRIPYTKDEKAQHMHTNGFFVCSNILLIPNHFFVARKSDVVQIIRQDPSTIGPNFEAYIQEEFSYHIPDTDFRLVWVSNGGDWASMLDVFPDGPLRRCMTRMLYKDREANISYTLQNIVPSDVATLHRTYAGAKYMVQHETFNGLCMAVHIAQKKRPHIVGFHLAGDGYKGALGYLTRTQLIASIDALKRNPLVVPCLSSSTILKEQYGVEYYKTQDIHPKSAVNYLPEGSQMRYFGQVKQRVSPISTVRPTMFAKRVEELFEIKNVWGPPQLRNNPAKEHYPYQKSLVFLAQPSLGMNANLLQYAYQDYLRDMLRLLSRKPFIMKDMRPLTRVETVSGISGKRFVDRMNASTSPGFPLSGRKDKWFVDASCEDLPDAVDIKPVFWEEVERMETLILQGKRCNAIFKSCLKDEAMPTTKDKVRVFQSAPLVLQLMIRMYFLPIARVLSIFPLTSECSVGINSGGPEWKEMMDHVTRFGKDRILAGDYSKYDLRMPPLLVTTAMNIMVKMAEYSGNYSEDQLKIMYGLITEVAYPIMEYNGDLIEVHGSNPSGHNLTVYVNSIVNSLLFRCGFASIYGYSHNFKDVVSLQVYGDDAISTVKEGFDDFNHISYAQFLDGYDMKFTMPDKESEPVPFMKFEDMDYLKRKSNYIPEIDCDVGALDIMSSMKSLCAVNASKTETHEAVCASVLDSAATEFFMHGKSFYDEKISHLRTLATEYELVSYATQIHKSFEDRVVEWKAKYGEDLARLKASQKPP